MAVSMTDSGLLVSDERVEKGRAGPGQNPKNEPFYK